MEKLVEMDERQLQVVNEAAEDEIEIDLREYSMFYLATGNLFFWQCWWEQ